MDSRFNCSLLIFAIIISIFFMACSKDDKPIIEEKIDVNHPVYVSEAEQGDYKNTYFYESVDGKIRLKQIDLFKLGVKKYDLKLRYDDQNRLVECKRSVSTSDYNYHENKILNEYLPSDYSIQYTANRLTVIDNDDADNTKIYDLGNDGFVNEMSWNLDNASVEMIFERSGNDFVGIDRSLSTGIAITKTRSIFSYDDKKSIDYLRVMLPCLCSEHNILRASVSEDGQEIRKITYAYTYRTFDFPVTILKNEITFNGTEEESLRTTTILKYMNADNL